MTELDLEQDDVVFESAADNPGLAEAAAAVAASSTAPEIPEPLDGPVTLPAGFHRVKMSDTGTQFEDVRTAWIRELNGEDEERISRAKLKDDPTAFLVAVLESGVERLGEVRPTRDDLDSLTFGDRDYLIMEIARATYGDDIPYQGVACPHCGESFDVTISIKDDIPVKRLDSVKDIEFDVALRGDRVAKCTLPTCEISADLIKAQTPAERNTLLIQAGVVEIRGPKGVTEIRGTGMPLGGSPCGTGRIWSTPSGTRCPDLSTMRLSSITNPAVRRRSASRSTWRICFSECNYRNVFNEIAALSDVRPTWTLRDIRGIPARERKFWLRRFRWVFEQRSERLTTEG